MSLKKSLFSVLLSSLALVGCGSGVDGQPDDLNDGRGPIIFPGDTSLSTDGGVDAGSPNEVLGSRVMHYRVDIGDFTQPVDPSSPPLRAFTLQGGATQDLTVQTSPDGTFRITDAPVGRYYLQLGTFYIVSDSRTMNLDRYDLGRRDMVSAPSATVTLSASNLGTRPYDDYPVFEAVSSNIGSVASMYSHELVPAGTTSVDKLAVSNDSLLGPDDRLVNASRGDRLYVNQFVDRSTGNFSYSTIDRFFTPRPITMSASASNDLSGTFQLASEHTAKLVWWRSRFEAYQVQVHPQAIPAVQALSISTTAWGSDAWYGYSGDLAYGSMPSDITDLTLTVDYGNPYPFSWGAVAGITHSFQIPATRLPGTTSGGISGNLYDTRKLEVATMGPIAPRITPPWDVLVDGYDAQQELTLGSLTPRVSWKAPLVGTASAYRIRISRLSASGTRTNVIAVAAFHTRDTFVDVPPGLMQPGQKYVITSTAYLTPGVPFDEQPYVSEVLNNIASATSVSSILTTPAAPGLAPSLQDAPEAAFELEPGIKPTRLYRMTQQLPMKN